jgi:hypothetical protein
MMTRVPRACTTIVAAIYTTCASSGWLLEPTNENSLQTLPDIGSRNVVGAGAAMLKQPMISEGMAEPFLD